MIATFFLCLHHLCSAGLACFSHGSVLKILNILFNDHRYVFNKLTINSAPPSKNALSHFKFHANYYLGRFLKKLADNHCSSITKGRIYHVNHMYIQPFTTVVDWPEIGCLKEVSALLYICRYCVFTWDGRTAMNRFAMEQVCDNWLYIFQQQTCCKLTSWSWYEFLL